MRGDVNPRYNPITKGDYDMHKFLTAITAALMLTACAFAQDANRLHYVQIMGPVFSNTTSEVEGAAVDISLYKGNACFLISFGADAVGEATYSNTVLLEHSANGTSGWATITNINGTAASSVGYIGTTNKIATYSCDLARLHKYVRASYTGVSGTGSVSVVLSAPMKAQ